MADDPLYEERDLALTSAECDPLPRPEVPDALPTPVEVPCDPQGNPIPEEFLPVKAPAAPVPETEQPPIFPIRNRPYTAVCESPLLSGPDSPVSYTVLAPLTDPPGPGEQGRTSLFLPAEVDGLTDSQRAYITTSLQDPVRKAAVASFLWNTIQDEDDMGVLLDAWLPITGWSSALSTIILTAALAQQEALTTTVRLLAESFLDCGYYNPPVVVCCLPAVYAPGTYTPEEIAAGYTVVETPIPDVDCETVVAETFFSLTSQEEATAQAVIAAARELDCIYWNFTAEVSCETLFPEFAGIGTLLSPGAGHPIITGQGGASSPLSSLHNSEFAVVGLTAPVKLVLFAETPANTIPAASQAEADAIARNMALAQLNCFFPSDWLEVDCTTEFPLTFGARADGLGSVDATLDEITYPGITTRHNDVFTSAIEPVALDENKTVAVTSPTGAFISTTDQNEATESAEQYAISLLQCLWRSPGVTCACYEPVTPGQDAYLYDEQKMAEALAKAPGLIAFNAEKSANQHAIPDGAFITPDFPGSDMAAEDPWAGSNLVELCLSYISCIFCNLQIEPECPVIYKDLGNGVLDIVDLSQLPGQTLPITIPEEYADYSLSPTFRAGLLPEVVCDTDPGSVGGLADSLSKLKPSTDTICVYGNPEIHSNCLDVLAAAGRQAEFTDLTLASQEAQVTVPANMFTAGGVTPAEAIDAAVAAAMAYAKSLLSCEFGNDHKSGSCEGDFNVILSTLSEVEAEVFRSAISKEDANRQAQIYVDLNTICFYSNDHKEGNCEDGYDTEISGIAIAVEGDFLSLISKEDANRQADNFIKVSNICFWSNDYLIGDCEDDYEPPLSIIPEAKVRDFISQISKDDANRQAKIYVDLGTVCAYCSAERTRTVTLVDDEATGCGDCPPGLQSPSNPNAGVNCAEVNDGLSNIGELILPCTFVSYKSKDDANDMAETYEKATNVALYTNDRQDPDPCPDGSESIMPSDTYICACTVISSVSKCQANEEAKRMANELQMCQVESDECKQECPEPEGGGGGGGCVTVTPDPQDNPIPCIIIEMTGAGGPPSEGTTSVTLDPGAITQEVSIRATAEQVNTVKEKVNKAACDAAKAQLNCNGFGNQGMLVKCCEEPNIPEVSGSQSMCSDTVFGSSAESADAAAKILGASLITCLYQNEGGDGGGSAKCPPCTEPTEMSEVNLPAGFVISLVSIADANRQAQTLAESMVLCTFCNKEEIFTCEEKQEDLPPVTELYPPCTQGVPTNIPGISWVIEAPSGMYKEVMHKVTMPKCAVELYTNLNQVLTPIPPATPGDPVTYQDNCEKLQEIVDKQAKQAAYAELGECLHPNPTVTGSCDPRSELEWVINDVTACEGMFMAKFESVAQQQAEAYVVGQLQCLYGNEEQEEGVADPPGCQAPDVETKGKVAKDTFIMSDQFSANEAAKALARAMAKCTKFADLPKMPGECDYSAHPWKLCVVEDGLGGLFLNVYTGSFIPCDAPTLISPEQQFNLAAGTQKVWVKATYSADTKESSELTAIVVEQPAAAVPPDSARDTYWHIGTVTTQNFGIAPNQQLEVTSLVQIMFEDVRLCTYGESNKRHSWYVSESMPPSGAMMLDVESGNVTSEDGTVFNYPGGQVDGGAGFQTVYLKLQYSGANGLVGISVEAAPSIPANTETEKYMVIAEVTSGTNSIGEQRITRSVQRLTEDVVLTKPNNDKKLGNFDLSVDEITPPTTPGGSPTCKVTYKGGQFYSPPVEITIADDAQRTSCSGSFWLKVTRNSASRLATAAVLHHEAFGATPTADLENEQYVYLMSYDLTQEPIHWSVARSGIVAVLEQMILENGRIKLATVDLAARYTYDPPTP